MSVLVRSHSMLLFSIILITLIGGCCRTGAEEYNTADDDDISNRVAEQQCACNYEHQSCTNNFASSSTYGICESAIICALRLQLTDPTPSAFCSSTTDIDPHLEYWISNGVLESFAYWCNDRPQCNANPQSLALLDTLRTCPWLPTVTDRVDMTGLRCRCNSGIGCSADGECSFADDDSPLAFFQSARSDDVQIPVCRYWIERNWKQPIVDCWLASRAYDRHMFIDDETVHFVCRDRDGCNDERMVRVMVASNMSSRHCPYNVDDADRQLSDQEQNYREQKHISIALPADDIGRVPQQLPFQISRQLLIDHQPVRPTSAEDSDTIGAMHQLSSAYNVDSSTTNRAEHLDQPVVDNSVDTSSTIHTSSSSLRRSTSQQLLLISLLLLYTVMAPPRHSMQQ